MSQHAQASSATATAVASPISAGSGSSTLTAVTTAALPQAHVQAAAELMTRMKESLVSYSDAIDSIGKQVVEMVQDGSENQVDKNIGMLRRHMEAQDRKQDGQILEIRALMQEVLEKDVVEHLTSLIEDGVLQDIDALVDQEVAHLLPAYIPQHLQDELRKHQHQLEEVQKALYNSESRRANSTLRSHRLHETVHDLYNINGAKSEHFPRTLGEMFAVSDERAISLMKEYGVGDPSPTRERNINRLMQSFGIQYQL
ncbi:hypothetical protein L227DRAFT_197279 [Lentinus tigrinus ALCF2SS1-6]|uniref:Uncharacterized protein n=1 Tax=Lentinus tigrinus ALCF2SS1-6 TaxID=1328759 RepID=A0A5C2S3S8_9APHY|nr:hypothetical protein L227DRAFT_197279 [Lentinus tigrinus ALCF2SS1-6]